MHKASRKLRSMDVLDSGLPEKADRLIEWMEKSSIWWSKELMQFWDGSALLDSGGVGVWAKQNVSDGARLCTIPKRALISVRNTSIADVLEAEELSGGLGLSFAVMYERALPASPWSGYLDFLPSREFLPMFWPPALLKLLHGTSLPAAMVHSDMIAMRDDYEQVVQAMDRHPQRFKGVRGAMDFPAFRIAASWVSSRAFYVDAYHEMCMVPLADVFNHKAAVVAFSSDYTVAEVDAAQNLLAASIHNDMMEPPEPTAGAAQAQKNVATGAPEYSQSDNTVPSASATTKRPRTANNSLTTPDDDAQQHTELLATAKRSKVGGGVCLPPVATVATGAPEAATLREVPSELRLEIAIIDAEEDPAEENEDSGGMEEKVPGDAEAGRRSEGSDEASAEAGTDFGTTSKPRGGDGKAEGALVIVAASDTAAGSEIHNTYGEYSNAELLYKHGFALRRNPFNCLSVSMSEVGAAVEAVQGGEAAAARMLWLRQTMVDCGEEEGQHGGEGEEHVGGEDDEDEDDGDEENDDELGGDGASSGSEGEAAPQEQAHAADNKVVGGSSIVARQEGAVASAGDLKRTAHQLVPEAVQGNVSLDGQAASEAEEEDAGGNDSEDAIDASLLQIFDGARASVAMVCVLWCLGDSLHGSHASQNAGPPAAPLAVLQKFAQWLQGVLSAAAASGGRVAAEASRVLEEMKGDGEEEFGEFQFLELKVPLEVVVGALDGAAANVLHEIMRARLEVLRKCVERVGAAEAALLNLADDAGTGAVGGDYGSTTHQDKGRCDSGAAAAAVSKAIAMLHSTQGASGGCEESEGVSGGGCSVAEARHAAAHVERLARWEVAAVEQVLAVCGAAAK